MKRTTWRDRLKARKIATWGVKFSYWGPTISRASDGDYISARRADQEFERLEREIEKLAYDLDNALRQMEEWKAAQTYRYIGVDGKPVLARELEERALKAEGALTEVKQQALQQNYRLTALQIAVAEMRQEWFDENAPKDGSDCVTPFDHL